MNEMEVLKDSYQELEEKYKKKVEKLKESEEKLKKFKKILEQTRQDFEKERDLLDKIINNNPYSIAIYDNEGHFERVNSKCLELFQTPMPPPEYSLFTDPFLLKAGYLDLVRNLKVGDALKLPDIMYNAHDVVLGAKDHPINVASIIFKIVDENNSVENIVIMHEDITARRKAELKLKESEEKLRNFNLELEQRMEERTKELKESEGKYRELFNYMSSGVAVYKAFNDGEDFIFKDFNLASEKMNNIKKEQLIGRKVTEIFPGVKDFGLFEVFQRVWKTGNPERHPISMYKDKRIVGWRDNYVYKLPTGELVAVYDDITERKKAEDRLKFLVSSSPAIIYTSKASGDYGSTFISENIKELTGYLPEDFTSNSEFWIDHIHPDDKENIISSLSKVFETGFHSHEYRFKFKDDNNYHWMRDELRLFIDVEGKPLEIIGFWVDITDQKNAEDQLKKSKEQFQYLISSSPTMIYTARTSGDYGATFMSENIKEIMGYNPEDFIENSEFWLNNVHIDDKERVLLILEKLYERDSLVYDYRFKFKDGTYHWMRDEVKLIRDEDGNAVETIGSWTDISDIKKAEEELINLNKIKSELLTRASHELKTPLISIKGYSDLLLELHKEKFDDMALSSIKQIKRGCDTLEKTVNNILNTTYLDSGQASLNLTVEDLSFLIKFVVNDLQGLALTRNHEISVNIQNSMIIKLEKERIYEVLSNLIVNAIKYTPLGGTIEIKSEKKKDSYVISVKDNGIGFSKEEKELIFKQFGKIERYGQGWDVGIEGTGLGLYISKKVIELHGGKIWMESKGRNKGSTFYFSLPIT